MNLYRFVKKSLSGRVELLFVPSLVLSELYTWTVQLLLVAHLGVIR